ncbi:MAG: hypothetical protein D6775_01375, partial [Caldilineae bacterium]
PVFREHQGCFQHSWQREIKMNDYDPATMDPPELDTEHPPLLELVKIESGGDRMNARLSVAQGPGPHSTVMLLHDTDHNFLTRQIGIARLLLEWLGDACWH